MSKKQKPPYLFAVENAEQAALLNELFQKSAVGAAQAHVMAALYAKAVLCAKHFSDTRDQ